MTEVYPSPLVEEFYSGQKNCLTTKGFVKPIDLTYLPSVRTFVGILNGNVYHWDADGNTVKPYHSEDTQLIVAPKVLHVSLYRKTYVNEFYIPEPYLSLADATDPAEIAGIEQDKSVRYIATGPISLGDVA
jgi:hypothetical protein